MMQRSLAFLSLVIVLASAALAGEKSNLPRQIVVARYVYVTDFLGRSDLSPSVHSQDRQAIYDVQQALKQWGRYTVVYLPEEADIVLVVRSGRLLSAQGTGSIPVGGGQIGYPRRGDTPNSPFPGTGRPSVGVEAGPNDDLLEVHDGRTGPDGMMLYRRLRAGGLNPPGLPMFKDFRNEVEKAAREDQEKKDAKKKKSP